MMDKGFTEFVDEPATNGSGHRGLISTTLHDFAKASLPIREKIISPIIPSKGIVMMYAARGVGKTHVAFGTAYAASSGGSFLRWHAPKARRTLYVDGEMPGPALQERVQSVMASASIHPPEPGYFRLLSMDMQALGASLNLANPEDQRRIEDQLQGAEFLVLDNLSTLVNGGRENDADSWDSMQAWLLQLRRQNVTTLLVHHAGRGDNARGTSKREDVLDTCVWLKRPDDYEIEEGARFEVHLTKARGVYGEDALPFEARLNLVGQVGHWDIRVIRDKVLDDVERLTREGLAVRDIAEELSLSKSKVNRIQGKLRAEGRLA